MSNMIFEDNELEIALATYNRALFVEQWLMNCYEPACVRNISISIYDSSTNDETKDFIQNFNERVSRKVNYIKISSDTIIGYKPMYPILNSKCKYV